VVLVWVFLYEFMAAERCAPGDIAAEDRPRLQLKKSSKKKSGSGHVVGVAAWQPDRVKWSQNLAKRTIRTRFNRF
jgi:hypothetical protein